VIVGFKISSDHERFDEILETLKMFKDLDMAYEDEECSSNNYWGKMIACMHTDPYDEGSRSFELDEITQGIERVQTIKDSIPKLDEFPIKVYYGIMPS